MKTIELSLRKYLDRAYFKVKKSPRYDYWRLLEKSQYLPESQLRKIQFQRLKKLIHFSYKNNKFYQDRFDKAGLKPDDIKDFSDIGKLPVLTKKDIRTNLNSMISSGYNKNRLLCFKTGGSTGKALDIYISEACSEMRNAVARRHDRWSGWDVGEPVGAIWGNPVLPKTIKNKAKSWVLSPNIYLDTMAVTNQSVRAFTRQWEKKKPSLIFGHAHSIFILAQFLDRLGINNVRPKGIISSSMMLMPHERKFIERVFNTKVTDRYGCEEVSLIASECEKHNGMHLNIEHLFIEFIDENGRQTAPGQPGDIVITDLMNWAMPFIRYKVEDVGIASNKKCECGRGLPLMESVAGRTADFLFKPDGTRVAGISLIENTLTRIKGLDQMQIIQDSINCLQINIVPGKDYNLNREKELVHYFRTVFGSNTTVDIYPINSIMAEKSGKYRFSICKIKN
ncbi:MAG: phenylacetate--CoA ligase family protein [Desulfobacteraceae bacterium]|nr:phenylacetate--CoA ligase family protein [Desulfobacteraceae bacterium]